MNFSFFGIEKTQLNQKSNKNQVKIITVDLKGSCGGLAASSWRRVLQLSRLETFSFSFVSVKNNALDGKESTP